MPPRKSRVPPAMQQVNFRLPVPVWQLLTAIADVLHQPQSRVVSDAVKRYVETLSPAHRHLVDQVLALRHKT